MKKIDFTNEDRAIIMEYMAAKMAKSAAEAAEKAAKAKAKELFSRLGKAFKATDKQVIYMARYKCRVRRKRWYIKKLPQKERLTGKPMLWH